MQVGGAREVAWHAVVAAMSGLHTLSMSKRGHPKHNRRPTFIKAWRKARGLTLERLSEQLLLEREVEITDGQLSRIERGESPYSQDLLEAIAEVLRCEPAHLLNVNPSDGENAMYSIWETLTPVQRKQAAAMLHVIKGDLDKTGSDG